MEIVIILIIVILLYFTVKNSDNKKKSNNMINLDNTDIKLITKENRCKNEKKYKTFISKPIQYQCLDDDEITTDEDRFINEYVFKSKLYCDKSVIKTDYSKKDLAEYRDGFFDFRNKTNISTNLITPVDNVNEMILTNPDLNGKNISDIYDDLVDNKQNLVFSGR
jgi:hypothetical protein